MSNPPAYLAALRQATRPLHDDLEAITESERFLDGRLDRNHYAVFLGSHARMHVEVARHASHALGSNPNAALIDWPDCPRIAALSQDLDQMQVEPPARDADSVPLASGSPEETLAFTTGLVYVAEGSCMGNQRLLSSLQASPEFTSWKASAFLVSCHAGFSERWKQLMAAMVQPGEQHYAQLEAGALAGFGYFRACWLALKGEPARP